MHLNEILVPEAVKHLSSVSSKKKLLNEISELASSIYGLDSETVFDALLARETLGPTGVGNGVALPHARLENVDAIRAVAVVLGKPVDFGSVDRQPVDIAVALFAPQQAGVEHLKALALVSRLLREDSLRSKLRANAAAVTLYTILTEAETTRAV